MWGKIHYRMRNRKNRNILYHNYNDGNTTLCMSKNVELDTTKWFFFFFTVCKVQNNQSENGRNLNWNTNYNKRTSPVIRHITITSFLIDSPRKGHHICGILAKDAQPPSNHEKTWGELKVRYILHNNGPVPFTSVKVTKHKKDEKLL